MKEQRHFSPLDRVISHIDSGLRTLFGEPRGTTRTNPSAGMVDAKLSAKQRKQVAGLMRVDHAGEVAAQALYQAQALTAKTAKVREKMQQSAVEENDHLLWCKQRLTELNSHKSYLDPLWYVGSF